MIHPSPQSIRSFRFCAGAALALALVGCTTGQTGGEVGTKDPGGGGLLGGGPTSSEDSSATGEIYIYGSQCEEAIASELDLDEPTSLGVSAAELIGMIDGEHEATLSWGHTNGSDGVEGNLIGGPSEEPSGLPVTPSAGKSTIKIEVNYVSGSAEFVERQQPAPEESDGESPQDQIAEEGGGTLEGLEDNTGVSEDGNGTTVSDDGDPSPLQEPTTKAPQSEPCPDQIRFEADVMVVSDNGAFDDTFRTTFTAKNGVFVSTVIELEPGALDGDFNIDLSDLENGKATNTQLTLGFAVGSMSGAITGNIEESDGNTASQMGMSYGHFPADSCEVGYLVDAESEWVKELGSTLEENSDFDFEWLEGEPTTLTIENTLGQLCYEPNIWGEGEILRADLQAKVSTEDGQINGDWPLSLQVYLGQDGRAELLNLYRAPNFGDSYSANDFESLVGINLSSEADNFSLDFSYFIQDGEASGTLTVLEVIAADCSSTSLPEQSPEGEDEDEDKKSDGSEEPPAAGDSNSDTRPLPVPGADTATNDGDGSVAASSGSPGCAGSQYVEIASAKFSKK